MMIEQISSVLTVYLDNICQGLFLQNFALIDFSVNSKNAVMSEVLLLPVDCYGRTEMSLT